MLWILLTGLSGGGVGGYLNPDWPSIGNLMQGLGARAQQAVTQVQSGDGSQSILGDLVGTNASLVPGGRPVSTVSVGAGLASSQRPRDTLLVATFNIQVFGESKLAKTRVVDVLVEVVRQFDIVAIQEVRAKSDEILPRFLAAINADGSRYSYLIGPRLGRSVSTEQYAFIYDTNRVEADPSSVGTIQDPTDLLHREPFIARFRPRTSAPERAFTFWLVNIHTDPDEVKEEVSVLADLFPLMQSARPDEDDVIILGDLNASETQLGRLGEIPGITWVVRNAMTNTRQNKAYDNLIFHGGATSEYTGRWGIVDLERQFGLTRDEALQVSDHLPVWAEFQIWEAPRQSNFADRLPGYRR
jgi:endonuclease/exonuclease/phosphatase family metal-dependent hydrolase